MSKIALVTGASVGFGRAIAEQLAEQGWHVIAAARRAEKLQELVAKYPTKITPWVVDVTDVVAIKDGITNLPDALKAIDLLVNNAGLALGLNPAHQAELADWDQMIQTNITGLVHLTHAILPGMVDRKRGHIINLGSVAGSYPYAGGNTYGATKAFVKQFSLNLRADLLGTGVRVTNIEPGLCSGTEFSLVRFHGDEARAEAVYQNVQALTAEDIANAVLWATNQPAHVNVNRI